QKNQKAAREADRFPFRRKGDGATSPPEQPNYILGRSTASTTWMTPFDCLTSAMVTVAHLPDSSPTRTLLPSSLKVSSQPPTVLALCMPPSSLTIFMTAAAITSAPITWQVRILVS